MEVVKAALAAPMPCPQCGSTKPCRCMLTGEGRIARQAAVVVAALVEYGHLPNPATAPEVTLVDVEECARFLAAQTRHPRYAGEDGWQRIMQSEPDVEVAFTAAARDASNAELADLNAVKRVLMKWLEVHPPEWPTE